MKKKITITVAVVASLSLVAGLALAFGPHRGPMSPERMDKYATFFLEDVMDELDASADQRGQMMQIKDRVLKRVVEERENHMLAKKEFIEEFSKDQPDPDKLHKLLDSKIDELRPKLHEGLDTMLEVHAVLTPEQRTKIQQHIQERRAKRGRWFHR